MTAFRRSALCVSAGVLLMAGRAHGVQPMRLQASPAMSRAPGFVTIRVLLEPDAGDRFLRIVAESPNFYRSSEVQMDGADAPPLSVFEFRDLPEGLYSVTGTLVGVHGQRAQAGTLIKVQAGLGNGR